MKAKKQTDPAAGKSVQSPPARSTERKLWKKKSPVEVVLDQAEKLRKEISEKEEELNSLQRQLQKFEEARKIFESA